MRDNVEYGKLLFFCKKYNFNGSKDNLKFRKSVIHFIASIIQISLEQLEI